MSGGRKGFVLLKMCHGVLCRVGVTACSWLLLHAGYLSLDETLNDLDSPQSWLTGLWICVLLGAPGNCFADKSLRLDHPRQSWAGHNLQPRKVFRTWPQTTPLLAHIPTIP